jgi:hypothetical protein
LHDGLDIDVAGAGDGYFAGLGGGGLRLGESLDEREYEREAKAQPATAILVPFLVLHRRFDAGSLQRFLGFATIDRPLVLI